MHDVIDYDIWKPLLSKMKDLRNKQRIGKMQGGQSGDMLLVYNHQLPVRLKGQLHEIAVRPTFSFFHK